MVTDGCARSLTISGSYAYIADGEGGLRIIDVSSPSSPQEVGFFDTDGEAFGVTVNGNYVYVADGDNGMYIIQNDLLVVSNDEDLSLPKSFVLHQNYPNPFNPTTTIQYHLPQRSDVQITVYDLLGREMTTLVSEYQDAGFKSVIWNATNDQGQPVSAGVYFYQVRAGDYLQTKKMILLK